MRTKKPKSEFLTELVGLRFSKAEYKTISKEAKEIGLELTAYLRMLVKTHPQRKGG